MGLRGPEIYVLIQAIAKEKITFERDPQFLDWGPQGINHFDEYKYHDWEFFTTLKKSPLPEEILSKFFQS